MFYFGLILQIAMSFFAAEAFAASSFIALAAPPPPSAVRAPELPNLRTDQWYRLTQPASLPVIHKLEREFSFNAPKSLREINLDTGTEFTVLKFSRDKKFALLGIDTNLAEQNDGVHPNDPVIVWVSTFDMAKSIFIQSVYPRLFTMESLGIVGAEDDDSQSSETPENNRHRMTMCLRDVHITSVRLSHRHIQRAEMASQALPKYQQAGWQPISFSRGNPIGTVCFFGGGRSCGPNKHCGHAAVKIRPKLWKGAGLFPSPFLRNHRSPGRIPYRFQGCLAPPGTQPAPATPTQTIATDKKPDSPTVTDAKVAPAKTDSTDTKKEIKTAANSPVTWKKTSKTTYSFVKQEKNPFGYGWIGP